MAWLIEVLFQDFLLGDCHSENFRSITSTKASFMLLWQPYNLSAYFSNFLLCFWNISTFEKSFIGSISMLRESVYSQKSIQNSFQSFTVETIQTIALPKTGIVTTLIDYYHLEQLFREVKAYLRWQLSEWLDQPLHTYILLKLILSVLALLLFQCWLC